MKRLSHLLMATLLLASAAYAEWTFRDVSEYAAGGPPVATTVAWGDVDNDGDPDLFVGGGSGSSVLYLNDDRQMVNANLAYGLATLNTRDVYGAQFVDFDGDGYLDLFLLTDDGHGFRLYRQLSNQRFQTVQQNVLIEFFDRIASTAWVDVDGDGRLDLILSNGSTHESPPVVIEHRQFELVEKRDAGLLLGSGAAGAIAVEDFDRDGDADVFLGGSLIEPARLMRRVGPNNYENWARGLGIPQRAGMSGAVWFDYNNDQQLDLYTPGDAESNCLMRGTAVLGIHGLVPVIGTPAVPPPADGNSWAHAVDADMDGWTDLFLTKSDVPGCQLLRNMQGGAWTDVTLAVGLNPESPVWACAWADWDGDGDLDLALAKGLRGLSLYRNDAEHVREFVVVNPLAGPGSAALRGCTMWMQFERAKAVGSTHPNTAAPGCDLARVLLVNSSAYKSARGNLVVRWPNGMVSQHSLAELTLGTTVTLFQPSEPPVQHTRVANARLAVSPNPFNPATTLSYTLAEAADVELKIFNLIGQEVATLVSGPQAAGTHRIAFNAGSLPSGLYLSRLTAGGQSHMSRLLLAK